MTASGASAQQATENWSFSATPYVWFSGISGTINVGSRDVSTSASFGDIFSTLHFAFMGAAEARYGRLGILGDLLYLDASQGVTPRGPQFSGGNASMQTLGLGLAALYRVVDDRAGTLDLGAGIRPWWIDSTVNLNTGPVVTRTASSSINWVDPVLAIRGSLRLGEGFSLSAYGDIGGFGAGSNLTWQALGSVDWAYSDRFVVRAGWRHLYLDQDIGRSQMKLTISGPIIGTTIRF